MYINFCNRHQENPIRIKNSLGIVTTTLAFILFFNASALSQSQGQNKKQPLLTIAGKSFWGGLSGFAVGAALIPFSDKSNEALLVWSGAGGLIGGLAYGIFEVTKPELIHVADWTAYGGGAGLAIDYIIDSVSDQNVEDNLKWFVIAGATAGLIYGWFTKPENTRMTSNKIEFLKPWVQMNESRSLEVGVNFVSLSL